MAYTEFCCRSGGSNLNAGTLDGSSTEPGVTASFTYASGSWVNATAVFTVASGNPLTDGVSVGQFASVYPDANTVTNFVGRITAVDATTITVSLSAKAGTAPVDGTTNTTLKVGGAWKGPNASESFPFDFATGNLSNTSNNICRVNFKNDSIYNITTNITHSKNGPVNFQGYNILYGDLGKAIIDGGTTGASYVLFRLSGNGIAYTYISDFVFQNNGSTGSSGLATFSPDNRTGINRCVFKGSRGSGGTVGLAIECEAYGNNLSNSSWTGGLVCLLYSKLYRCISAYNNGEGIYSQNRYTMLDSCIVSTNGGHGVFFNNISGWAIKNCDIYNNNGHGLRQISTLGIGVIESSNFIKNQGYGITVKDDRFQGVISNCGFGAGTESNTSGEIQFGGGMSQDGNITYPADSNPWVDPDNGDFRINLANAKGTGRGAFTQTEPGQSGAVGYPDIGAAQSAGGGTSNSAGPLRGVVR